MKKLLIFLGLFLIPFAAFAANYNDVTLTTDTVISVGGYTLNVSGSSAAIASIVVSDSSFNVSLLPGSSIQVNSPTGNLMNVIGSASVVGNVCADGVSSVSLTSASQTETDTITPTSTVCGAGGGGGSGGGGGGSSAPVVTPSVTVSPAVTVSTTTSVVTSTTVPAVTPTQTTTQTAAGLQAQIAAMLAEVSSLQAQLGSAGGATSTGGAFDKSLSFGSRGADVLRLQKVLNSDSDTQVAASGAGSPGNETTYFGSATKAAVEKFQVKYGIANPGDPGYGNFGPKTRAKAGAIAATEGL